MDNRLLIVAGVMFTLPWIGMGAWYVSDKYGEDITLGWQGAKGAVSRKWNKAKALWAK